MGAVRSPTSPCAETASDSCANERLRYTGHERDHLPGIDTQTNYLPISDYMHARVYVPMMTRFVAPDPKRSFNLFNPQSMNRYSYVLNNPMTLVDPFRLEGQPGEKRPKIVHGEVQEGIEVTATDPFSEEEEAYLRWRQAALLHASAVPSASGALGLSNALLYALRNQNNPTMSGHVRLGRKALEFRGLRQWQRSFHIDTDAAGAVHFNADFGPLAFANHWPLPKTFAKAGTSSFLNSFARRAGAAGLAYDIYALGTASSEDLPSVTAGVLGGWGGAPVQARAASRSRRPFEQHSTCKR